MVYSSILQCIGNTPLVRLKMLFSQDIEVMAKLEFLNPGGSVKDRPARFIVEAGLRDGTIHAGTHLIESSSGNLGVALAMVVKAYKLPFTCVVDPKITPTNLKLLELLGARICMVDERDENGGYLKTRIRRVHELVASIPGAFWINQYANQQNWRAHYEGTGSEIVAQLDGPVDCAVIAVSTTGTILGIARRLREVYPNIRVVAVDAVGSVIFGTPAGPRELPGIGSSRVPELLCPDEIDEVIHVTDQEAVEGCFDLLKHEGIFAGGSSGSVIAAIKKMRPSLPSRYRIVTLLPDRGDRYLDLVYDETWVANLPQRQDPVCETVDKTR